MIKYIRDWFRGWTEQDERTYDQKVANGAGPHEVIWLTRGEANVMLWKSKRIYGYF